MTDSPPSRPASLAFRYEVTSLRLTAPASTIMAAVMAGLVERGMCDVTKTNPVKCTVSVWQGGLAGCCGVKIRLYGDPGGYSVLEFQRRCGDAFIFSDFFSALAHSLARQGVYDGALPPVRLPLPPLPRSSPVQAVDLAPLLEMARGPPPYRAEAAGALARLVHDGDASGPGVEKALAELAADDCRQVVFPALLAMRSLKSTGALAPALRDAAAQVRDTSASALLRDTAGGIAL